jgi:AcrR family transcriptional regulator
MAELLQDPQRSARPEQGRRHSPLVRRRLVIEAAREVIARRGMAATRMRELAAAAGVSLGTLSYHFSGIDEVLAGVIEAEETDFLLPLVEHALAAETGREGLRRLVDGLLNDGQRTREHWLLWLDFWTLATRDATYGRWQHESFRAWRDVVAELVDRGRVDGSLTVANQESAVRQFMALLDGVAVQTCMVGRESDVASEAPNLSMWAMTAEIFAFTVEAPIPVGVVPGPGNR